MDFSQFFPTEYHGALSYLGKRPWLLYEPTADYNVSISPDHNLIDSQPFRADMSPALAVRVDRCVQMAENDHIKAMWMLAVSKLLGYGPKMFEPTTDDCLASLETKIGMRFEDYRQPYEAVIIKIPDGFQDYLRRQYNLKRTPKYAVPFYDIRKSFVCVSAFYDTSTIICNLIPNRPEYETIQDCFDFNRNRISYTGDLSQDPEITAAEDVQRLAMNFCLLMTLRGIRNTGPLEAAQYLKLQTKLKKAQQKKNRMDEAAAKTGLLASIQGIKLHQEIKIYATEVNGRELSETEEEQASEGRRSGRLMPVHWRNGYHRMQRFGPRNAYRKRIYIKPVWVNLHRLGDQAPDPAQTTVTYKLVGGAK
jgi:hypothetical protein